MCRRVAIGALNAGLVLTLSGSLAFAHVDVVPEESLSGTTVRYGIRVPSEKDSPTIRVEVQFPNGLRVGELEAVPGWRVSAQKDAGGGVVGAIWEGGNIPPGQFVEFGVLARNPDGPTELAWKVIQTYQDGSEVQWIGPPGAQFEAAVTRVHSPGAGIGTAEILAGVSLLISVAAAVAAGLAWRRAVRAQRR